MAQRKFSKRRPRGKPVKYSKSKKMVTGHGPTLLDRIASGVGSVAQLANAVAPAIAAINTEHKYYDETAAVTAYNPGTNDVIQALTSPIAEGTGDSERIGNSILLKDLQVRLAGQFTSTSTVVGVHCRMMLVAFKGDVNAIPITANLLFESPTNLYSPINKDNSDQLVVMKDKFFTLNAQSIPGAALSQSFFTMKLFKKIDWHARFNDAGNATTNHIFLVLRCSSPTTANALGVTYYSRLNYTDN